MPNQLKRIAEELFDKPLLTQPGYAEKVLSALAPRLGLDNFASSEGEFKARESSIVVSGGIAHVPIMGSLTHRASNLDAPSGLRSYQSISNDLDEAVASGAETILMEIDSPGGSVSGAFDAASKIAQIADDPSKPRVIAFVNGTAASAAYLLASQANQIWATETSQVGSIGVVVAHQDVSEANKQRGVKIEYIHAGARKVDGNPNAPLSEDARASIQLGVDKAYEKFVEAVSVGRGISAEVIQSTEAAIMPAEDGVEFGMVDRVVSEYAVLTEALSLNYNNQGVNMSKETLFTQEQMDAAVTSAVQAEAAKATSAVDMAVKGERDRISGIMALDEYKGREPLAQKFIDKGMSVEDTKEFLASSPVEKSTETEKTPAGAGQMAAMNAIIENSTADVKPAVGDHVNADAQASSNPNKVDREVALAAASLPGTRGAMRRNAQ